MTKLKDMNQDQLIAWINTLPLSVENKNDIISGIKEFAATEEVPVTGENFDDAEDISDIKELTSGNIGKVLAKKMLAEVSKKKDQDKGQDFDSAIKTLQSNNDNNNNINNNNNNDDGTFKLSLIAQKGNIIQFNVTKSWTVSKIKAEYLESQGDSVGADKYRMNRKWDSNKGKIDIIKSGKVMKENNRTLESYGIASQFDAMAPLTVLFKVKGGAESKHSGDGADQYRVRKLRRNKYKGMIKLSQKADCIMGYEDADKIRRAEMPCKCAIAADTMWRYMKALFEKDFKGTKLICPTPRKLCEGNDKDREWPWNLIYIVADLSPQEIAKYSQIITNRIAGTKNCPHCGATTERPQELRICRVACNQCSGSDWCWNCTNVWRSGGLGPICGNKDCRGAEINDILKNCDWIKPTSWGSSINQSSLTAPGDKDGKVPQFRACPKCCSIIQYTQACKHMECICCPHEFCFNCLVPWGYNDGQCNGGKACNLYKSNDGKFQQIFT